MERENEIESVINEVKENYKPNIINVKDAEGQEREVLVIPEGLRAQSTKDLLKDYATKPDRRKGIACLSNLDSFIDLTNRFKDDHSAIYIKGVNENKPVAMTIFDYHEKGYKGEPRFGGHRAYYDFPISKEWLAFMEKNKSPMDQFEFSMFIDDNLLLLTPPPVLDSKDGELSEADKELKEILKLSGGSLAGQVKMIELSKGIAIHQSSKVKTVTDPQTGEVKLQYETEHNDHTGQRISVPSMFCIALPVFKDRPPYRVAVRLRYRLKEGEIKWFFELINPEKIFEHAINEIITKIKESTSLPVFLGTAEC